MTVLENSYCSEIKGSVFASAERHPSTVDFWKQIVTCDAIELSLTAGEDERFGERLTVELTLPDSWEAAELTSYGRCERLTPRITADGSRCVYASILPGKEISVLRRIR